MPGQPVRPGLHTACAVLVGREGGGARRDRTVDLLLAKQALSQLSYGPNDAAAKPRDVPVGERTPREWWVWVDSNYRPHPYQGCALTN